MEGFGGYLRIVRKRGPQPFWTPVAPLHRIVSYPLSYLYVGIGLAPLAVTLIGLAIAVAGAILVMGTPLASTPFFVGVGLLNLGIIHDACDGEVARYRLHKGLQQTATYRVGMFADFWAFAVMFQALLPIVLGVTAWRGGLPGWLAVLGAAAAFTLLGSYVAGFARSAYWPETRSSVREESFSFAAGGGPLLRAARRLYFWMFETAMFTFHASVVLVAWSLVGGRPVWVLAYVGFVGAALLAAFLVATAQTLRTFDRVQT
ncbi:MAG TPA: CDP-alcohol phosphatidyltransferase family protein [Candidatus Thermoplasmatota archaeon]|nr:CDP-alcohol phosphatidyltransferase family protein [Candidatus Thermoplasmatota archaeon]